MNKSTEGYFKFPLGSPMPNMVRLVGIFLQLAGIFSIISQPLTSIVMITIGCFASYQIQGVEIDLNKNQFRLFHSILGVKTGKWLTLYSFPFLTVLHRKTSQRVFGMSAAYHKKEKEFYSVVLMNRTHHIKYALQSIEGAEQAKKMAQTLAQKLNLEVVNYNPLVTHRTRTRR